MIKPINKQKQALLEYCHNKNPIFKITTKKQYQYIMDFCKENDIELEYKFETNISKVKFPILLKIDTDSIWAEINHPFIRNEDNRTLEDILNMREIILRSIINRKFDQFEKDISDYRKEDLIKYSKLDIFYAEKAFGKYKLVKFNKLTKVNGIICDNVFDILSKDSIQSIKTLEHNRSIDEYKSNLLNN